MKETLIDKNTKITYLTKRSDPLPRTSFLMMDHVSRTMFFSRFVNPVAGSGSFDMIGKLKKAVEMIE